MRAVLALLCLTSTLLPQELLWERVGVERMLQYQYQVVSIGDVSGDGWSDVIVIGQTLEAAGGGVKRESVLFLLSGRDGAILRVCAPPGSQRAYSVIEPAGDWNLDGVGDYAASDYGLTGGSPRSLRLGMTREPAKLRREV